jgi:hypothetical protein
LSGDGSRHQLITVNAGATVNISGVTVENGDTSTFFWGGAILNAGTLTLSNIVATGNVGSQGAILNQPGGEITLTGSTLYGNSAQYYGGGLENATGGGAVTIVNSAIFNNSASTFGGGIANFGGPMTVINSTIANNTTPFEGGGFMGTATPPRP